MSDTEKIAEGDAPFPAPEEVGEEVLPQPGDAPKEPAPTDKDGDA